LSAKNSIGNLSLLKFCIINSLLTYIQNKIRLKKIQDKKKIARGKAEAAKAAYRLKNQPDPASLIEEQDDDIMF
jgi:hypothetical protein